ncbi:MAG: hypothetical protein ACXAC5_02745 [Promethearchaeota archaeon]|jgi:hypothetical protein
MMCVECANSARKHFPLLTTKEQIDLLWCGTCYPADHGEIIEKQFSDLEQKSNGEYELAMEIAHREFDEAWEATRPMREQAMK